MLCAVAVVAAVASALSDRHRVFEAADEESQKGLVEIRDGCKAADIVCAMSFDGPFLRNWATARIVPQTATKSVPGARGDARRFTPTSRDALIDTGLRWAQLGTNGYSVLLRFRVTPGAPSDQDLCYAAAGDRGTGFALRGGQLRFAAPTPNESAIVETPFVPSGRFVTALAVADPTAGAVRLYVNGVLCDTRPWTVAPPPSRHILFRTASWHPIQADIDEFVLWRHALPEDEIAAVSRPSFESGRHVSPEGWRRHRSAEARRRRLPDLLRALERFHPACLRDHGPRLPTICLHIRSSVRHAIVHAHESSLRNGERSRAAAHFRACRLETPSALLDARVCLDDVYADPDRSPRLSYIVEVTDPAAPDDEPRLFRLYPPENHAVLHRGDPVPLPVDDDAYVRLCIGRDAPVLYCWESLDRLGNARLADLKPATSIGPARGQPVRALSRYEEMGPDEQKALLRRLVRRIVADPRSQWSFREWRLRIRNARDASRDGSFLPPCVSELDALGRNEAPFWIESDLILTSDVFRAAARWESSRPDLIDGSGHVTRPSGDLPQIVVLSPRAADGTHPDILPDLRFRVVPKAPRLPALMLHVSTPVTKVRRTDFTAVFHPAGGGAPRRLRGLGDAHAGIRHRGNTSYVRSERKPFSLKFDTPHGILGLPWSRHLHLNSGYADNTRMRNKLSMDVFQAMQEDVDDTLRIGGRLDWVEVFVNGKYFGVYEMGTQDNRETFPPDSSDELFKLDVAMPLFSLPHSQNFIQLFPDMRTESRETSLVEFLRFVNSFSDTEFHDGVDTMLDVDRFIDFMLLLNFTGNYDGQHANIFVGRENGAGHYYIVPRDYDRAFYPNKAKQWMGNLLDSRLRAEMPDYKTRMRTRWQALRQGPCSDAALDRLVDGYVARLRGYMEEDYAIMGRATTFDEEVRRFRTEMHGRVCLMDGFMQ